jgi:uncharacterized protein YdeI (YjbR/CyaY-like superfamily)
MTHPTFFATPAAFRAWLEEHHETHTELLVGFYKKASGRPSITWPEAVDQALCFGWIDGVRRGIDADSYSIRFTSRKPRSFWSNVNITRAQELIELGLMAPAGRRAFEARAGERSDAYSYENREAARLGPEQERQFREHPAAWEWFERQPPSYRRAAAWWVVSAKREETRRSRLAALIEDSARGRPVRPLARP